MSFVIINVHHLLPPLFVCFFFLLINAQRYGGYGYGSGTYGTNNWGSSYGNSGRQPSHGYGMQPSRYGTNEQQQQQNSGEEEQLDRQNEWTERGGQNQQQRREEWWEGGRQQQPQRFGQNYAQPHWTHNQQQSHDDSPSVLQPPQSNDAKLHVVLPPGAPGTAEAADANDQSSK